ncbi:uncharacterized protein LOC125651937 [Ostrea edulis]|uniref:uncharacterized protein LOC125651937 n=1 Tax=Ostrea edulis TaxID=37623 RepID=UPI0024AF30C2|nr:uncharacterized protein LOC125651937 [Ostrea edulis]
MDIKTTMYFLCLCLFFISSSIVRGAPCYTLAPGVVYYRERICACWRWWPWRNYCIYNRFVTRSRYALIQRCCPGYVGSDCGTPICNCKNGGTCVAPDVCSCPLGYGGNSCQIPLCNPTCKNGYCTSPNQCTCYPKYKGPDCSDPICEPECKNKGVCQSPDTCLCDEDYGGPTCTDAICKPHCLNGGSCTSPPSTCSCTDNYNGSRCQTPVCNPQCQNGGSCVSPDTCSCLETYTGSTCETPLCSHHSPCFPGECTDTINCQCNAGFTGDGGLQRCKTLDTNNTPIITKCSASLANIERTGDKRELYRFMTDSSDPNSTEPDMLWLSDKDYNYVIADFSAIYAPPDNFTQPDYVANFTLGIVKGKMLLDLRKVDRKDPNNPFISLNRSIYECPSQPGSANPSTGLFLCNVTNPNFDRLLEDGDNLTLTVVAENGGFRTLKKPSNTYENDYFIGQTSQKSMLFRFDFRKPHHCLLDGPCQSKAFTVDKDITKDSLTFSWDGWSDSLSGMGRYTIQEFLLKPNENVNPNLTEPNPWDPSKSFSFSDSERNFTYTPDQPGMYAFLLNVIDNANNTQYARTLVLYDNQSSVTIDTNSPLIATSAAEETNYKWQNSLTTNISISWRGHFRNTFHENNKLLVPVTPYKYYNHYVKFHKAVPDKLEDKYGDRTLARVTNVHGIVGFQYTYRHVNQGSQPPSDWNPVSDINSQTASFNIPRSNGDGLNVWVKATDVLGNKQIDVMQVYFDETPPDPLTQRSVNFIKNLKNSTFPFSSRLVVEAHDGDSGIHKISWIFKSNYSDAIFKTGFIPGNKSETMLNFKDGYDDRMGDYFYYSHYLEVNNCWMVVSKENFQTEFINLELTAYNRALESTNFSLMIPDLESLDGIDEYSGPTNLRVVETFDNGVRLQWIVSPTCYTITRITVTGVSTGGKTFYRLVDKDSDYFDLTGLDSETTYNLSFVTEYGNQRSDPVFLTFRTMESPAALTTGAIAGISTVMLILLGVIIAGVILWRTGRLTVAKQGIQRRMTVARQRIQNRFSHAVYNIDQEDIYLYGQMTVSESEDWVIPHAAIVLESLLTSGRFADIYKVRYNPKKGSPGDMFVAKLLKSGYTDEDQMSMRAKINYYVKKVGEHPNILRFVGAAVDDLTLGPYMVLELCELGQLSTWLQKEKDKANEDTSEQLCRISYGISKGMFHLETRKLVHRRLAARNVLLTGELEPKIYGFCPQNEAEADEKDNDGDVKEDKERIPVKWTAPECLESMRKATPKSDVWSYGVVLWEIFSFGEVPYPGIRSRDVQAHLRNGNRMNRPEFANEFYYNLMTQCWQRKRDRRPSFKDITADIGKTFNTVPSDDFYYYSENQTE